MQQIVDRLNMHNDEVFLVIASLEQLIKIYDHNLVPQYNYYLRKNPITTLVTITMKLTLGKQYYRLDANSILIIMLSTGLLY